MRCRGARKTISEKPSPMSEPISPGHSGSAVRPPGVPVGDFSGAPTGRAPTTEGSPPRLAGNHNRQNLRVSYLVTKSMTVDLALVGVYKRVSSRSRIVPAVYLGEEHPVASFRGAVRGYAWAAEPLGCIATNNMSFQQLYAKLSS